MMIQSVPGNLFQAFHHPGREQAFIPIDHVNHAVLEIDFPDIVFIHQIGAVAAVKPPVHFLFNLFDFPQKFHLTVLTMQLSIPAIMAQLSSIVMQYIDASMVGHLGSGEAASIGLMSSSTWMMGGLCSALSVGFTVQVAHFIGAKEEDKARGIVRQGLAVAVIFSCILLIFGVLIHQKLPLWLGGEEGIRENAAVYFLIYCL